LPRSYEVQVKVRPVIVEAWPLLLLKVMRTLGFPLPLVLNAKLPNENCVQLKVGVTVGVLVLVGVFVTVDVFVGVFVAAGVFVGVNVGVSVTVGVGESVNVGVMVGVFVAVSVGPIPLPGSVTEREVRNVSTTPWRQDTRCTIGHTWLRNGVING
jgi:hypothetical protein